MTKKGYVMKEEAKRKISNSLKGHIKSDITRQRLSNSLKGHIKSDITRQRLSNSHKGKVMSETTKQKMRNIAKNNLNFTMKGKHHSKETKQRLRELSSPWNRGTKGICKANSGSFKKGKILSEETKKRMSLARIGKILSEETKKRMSLARRNQVLPKIDTKIEVKIQNFLKQLNIDFLTHQYIKNIEHGYQCDILIPSMNLVIECDGDYWHKYPIGKDIDHIRTSELITKGFIVLRLWGFEITNMNMNEFMNRLPEIKEDIK